MTPSTTRQSLAAVTTGWLLAYTQGTALYLRRYAGQSYTDERIASGVTAYALAADGAQRALLAYVARGRLQIRRSSDGAQSFGAAFTATLKAGSQALPAAYVSWGDDVVAWGSGSGLHLMRYVEDRWKAETLSGEATAGFPALTGDGKGRLWCAWREGDSTFGYGVYLNEYAGKWGSAGCVASGMDPALAWDGDLRVGYHTGGFSAYAGRCDMGRLQDVERLDSSGMFVALAPGAAVWSRYSKPGDPKADSLRTVAGATWDGRGWVERAVTSATGGQVRPSVAVDALGRVGVAWVDQDQGEVVMVEGVG